jgi:hypothetical protein
VVMIAGMTDSSATSLWSTGCRRASFAALAGAASPVLQALSTRFTQMYTRVGRPSIAPKILLLQGLYSIRSERLLMEQLNYNLLFRWLVGGTPIPAGRRIRESGRSVVFSAKDLILLNFRIPFMPLSSRVGIRDATGPEWSFLSLDDHGEYCGLNLVAAECFLRVPEYLAQAEVSAAAVIMSDPFLGKPARVSLVYRNQKSMETKWFRWLSRNAFQV